MQVKISKTLEGIIARAAFNTTKAGIDHSLKDFLMLEMLREEGSLAYQLLSSRLKDWELYQVRLRIEREVLGAGRRENTGAEEFYRAFTDELCAVSGAVRSVSTAHALRAIVGDRSTATSRVLEMYGITGEVVSEDIKKFAAGDDFRTEIQVHMLDFSEENKPEEKNTSHVLDKFGVNLTQMAREGKIDPVVGREQEIERVVQILSRRKKNNPILIGEAGVGKSAIIEGLALRIARGEVPYTIADKTLFSLDVSSLVAGTKFRGEFEERMQQLLDELRKAKDTIIFIDEIHTIVGAGSTQGSLDTANILKPALARGELQTIGATTLDEYRENIESDSALERRFQKVVVEPTTPEQTLQILRNIAPHYEQHHKVRYTEEALQACVELTGRYITDRFFPDKAIDVLDEAGSRIHLQSAREPAELRQMESALDQVRRERREAVKELVYEKAASARLREIALRSKLGESRNEWQRSLETNPVEITAEHIQQVITSMTGIPAERISGGEMTRLQTLCQHLSQRVVGQQEAVEKISRTIRRSRAGLKDENRPIGVFLFVGPTGVGKTLLAKEVSKWLFDEQRGLIRIDMSEYSEKHNVARLIGSPPGYVGYGEGGQLTETVRRQPYAVILFDEIEKAHPEVFNTMLQIFDEGHLTDGSGRKVDFRNTIIIMTSNVGSRDVVKKSVQVGYSTVSKSATASATPRCEYRKALEQTFAPEFLNRIDDIVLFRTLELSDVERIIELELQGLFERTRRLGYKVKITDGAKRRLAAMGYESRYGVRSLKRTLMDNVEEPLSTLIIDGKLHEGDTVVVESDKSHGVKLRVA
ncbi:ATP-dependent Clp protease ATP-binding subunit [uncultured Alistipes sp.]|jgi:ATP-dependent Clp protease ATP-binding subunit ClpC|uniref:ATP-dependent Clp protease ATP-binding subunit n=1 Tax=uncultured Alistipes sp. TaxID=538949 RepID=UPI00259214EF|nr:ATP-dependent Clp protease ATP-binding subunit [uncultured Alistipes sp.]